VSLPPRSPDQASPARRALGVLWSWSTLAIASIALWILLVIALFATGAIGGNAALPRTAASAGGAAAAPPTGLTPTISAAELQAENQQLRSQVQSYQSLQEDLLAQQVYEKAWGKMVSLFTAGGIITGLLGLIGYREVMNLIRQKSEQKIGEITQAQIETMLKVEAKQQITLISQQQIEELRQYSVTIREQQEQELKAIAAQLTQQSITQIQVSSNPLTGVPEAAAAATPQLPGKVDYSGEMGPVRNQGSEGSVVGFAVAAAVEYQIFKTTKARVVISPRYIYNLTRAQEGTAKMDAGAQIKDALRLIAKSGAVEESVWPYVAGEFAADPPDAVKDAKHYRIKRSRTLTSLDEMKQALQADGPIVIGFTVYQSMMGGDVVKTGVIPMPATGDSVIGGHAVCAVGYDDDRQVLKLRNSWGPEWGDQGYGYLPYAYTIVNAFAISM
jgi:C1A family cysteine protease